MRMFIERALFAVWGFVRNVRHFEWLVALGQLARRLLGTLAMMLW